jgi:hypothetical protein
LVPIVHTSWTVSSTKNDLPKNGFYNAKKGTKDGRKPQVRVEVIRDSDVTTEVKRLFARCQKEKHAALRFALESLAIVSCAVFQGAT